MATLRSSVACCACNRSMEGKVAIGPLTTDWTRRSALGLSRTQITDESLEHLAAFPKLVDIKLSNPAITAAGLAHLKTLERLRSLQLDGTKITDRGMRHLTNLTDLVEGE